jgi:2-succinyl-5-enolpyruvyl-6-hydroxy-3-cyclohexene-1-carboxylate synthase
VNLDPGAANLHLASALVDQLATSGVRHVVICPGSRSTPIAVSLASHPDIRNWVLVDERSAAFFALGMARQLAAPVAILSTSGTAAANFLPAVVESRLSRIPLIVLTADRPPELRDWGAAQTIDQIQLFGSHVKWFVDMPVPDADDGLVRHARATAQRAVQTARTDPAGPVHLNLPFREPLLPADLRLRLLPGATSEHDRHNGPVAYLEPGQHIPDVAALDELASQIAREARGIIVCGPGEAPWLAAAAAALSDATGYPILADPLSGVRFGPHDRAGVIDAYDPFLRDQVTAESLHP